MTVMQSVYFQSSVFMFVLTSIHVLQGFLCLLWCLKLHVGVAFGEVRVDAVHGHVNHLDLAISGEDLLDVFLQKHNGEPFEINCEE